MNRLGLFGLLLLFAPWVQAQDSMARFPINETGCSLLFPDDPGQFEVSYSDDGLPVYTAETIGSGELNYAAIVIQLDANFAGSDSAALESLMEAYFEYLQGSLGYDYGIGTVKGLKMEENPKVAGISDFWSNENDNYAAVRGWSSDTFLAVLLIFANEMPADPLQKEYFEGFRFP